MTVDRMIIKKDGVHCVTDGAKCDQRDDCTHCEKRETELLICGCCGRSFYGIYDGSQDTEFGTCKDCVKWSHGMFFGTRIKLLRERLGPVAREKFNAMTRKKQEWVIGKLIEKGAMI